MDHLGVAKHPSSARSTESFNRDLRAQGARLFAVWKEAGFPQDQRPVSINGQAQLRPTNVARAMGF